jgi:hypothetical protein
MAIQTSDIQYRLSGGAANSNPNASLGGIMSSTAWAGGVLHDLFDVITGDENAASDVEYRCVYVRNAHGTLTWESVKAWLTAAVAGGADLAIGLDPAGAGNGSTTGVAVVAANEGAAPAGVTFSAPATKSAGLSLGDIAAGQAYAIWFKRSATNSAPLDDDGATLNVEGDTAA